jgi:hypothetical protein
VRDTLLNISIKTALILSVILFTTACRKGCQEKKCTGFVSHELNPVCGCNNITYENPSFAQCFGIEKFTFGACEKD